jgi:hypothetical protein
MYGTVARIRPKPGQMDEMTRLNQTWEREHAPNIGGFVASYLKDAKTQVRLYGPDGTFVREVDNLLVDISQSALAAGLEQELFQPQAEVRRDFYAELPIRMRLSGDYHSFATFASNVAALS